MQERLKQLPKRLLELWNKYTSKQKTIIISVFSGVVLALAILIVLLSRTKYVTLSTFQTTTVATG
ncbi:MAG: flagellar M-ring protein FliF, partial [Lachnospiraceae bacterium]